MSKKMIHFVQPNALKYQFEIYDEDAVIGTLVYNSFFHNKAVAVYDGNEWEFSKKGFFRTTVIVTDSDNQEIAKYQKPFIGAGHIDLAGGNFVFKSNGLGFKSYYAWRNQDNEPVVTYANGGVVREKGDISVDTELLADQQRVLIPLGLFLSINQDADSSSAAAAGATGG